MSKAFCLLVLLFSLLMLIMGLTNSDRTKPAVMLFWVLIGAVSAYKLVKKPSPAS